jgi:hypothetical protein
MPTRAELIWDGSMTPRASASPPRGWRCRFRRWRQSTSPPRSGGRICSHKPEAQARAPWLPGGTGSSGDKKYVLPSLLPEFAGKVNLIYIDPPFDTGADFSVT